MMLDWLFGRRRKALAAPFPADWEDCLQRNCRHFRFLPSDQQERLRNCTKVIVAERDWHSASEQAVTDEMQVTIAAQAALLLLGVEGYFFDKVGSIVVHPQGFHSRTTNSDLHSRFEGTRHLAGEAFQHGTIVLAWQEALAGARGLSGGSNLVLHEFAHHLDSLDGEMGGIPPLSSRSAAATWREIINHEFEQLTHDIERGSSTLLDPYGATNKAEFFAVATECFYERPRAMASSHAELYQQLSGFYQIDPRHWWPDVDALHRRS